jgi:hypothetical protein
VQGRAMLRHEAKGREEGGMARADRRQGRRVAHQGPGSGARELATRTGTCP